MDNQKQAWDDSFARKENFLFHPNEEVIRFASRHLRKQTGLREFREVSSLDGPVRLLDLGCGIGRHVVFAHQMGLEAYGIDLSEVAIRTARQWATEIGAAALEARLVQGDLRRLPWADRFFPYVVSHGVLDSMPFALAQEAMQEVARVMSVGGLFYCDLISGDDAAHAREYAGEEVVSTSHEAGTVQSYFNYSKITQLVRDRFEVLEASLIRRENVLSGHYHARYHLVLKRT
jgi:ubiquinone/menaquinone biosynthesis C-methylase UbiE